VYPPLVVVWGAPWALLSYPAAAWLHALLAILAACWLARDMARYFFADRDDAFIAALLFLAFLPLWRVWMFGQNSIWALAVLWGAWRLWRAGAWLWAMLWGNRRLRSGLIVGLGCGVAVGMICGGPAIWMQWLDAVRNTTALVERIDWMTSLPHAWKLIGGEYLFGRACIYAVMLAGGVLWGIALLRMKYKNASPTYALCFALFGSWILAPRLYVYDWILAWPLLLAAWRYGTPRVRSVIAWGGLLFWIHDLFGMMHVPILTLVGVAVFVWLLAQRRWSGAES
jgi:hypothetical protein